MAKAGYRLDDAGSCGCRAKADETLEQNGVLVRVDGCLSAEDGCDFGYEGERDAALDEGLKCSGE
jgi:hypothetical protein